jgi:hypothetical protein
MQFTQSNLEIETCSLCNRVCPTCMRNSFPYPDDIKEWFDLNFMSTETILDIVQQAYDLGFRGNVNLSRFNEPLYDKRLPDLGRAIKKIGNFEHVMFHSNGDLLTQKFAKELDEVFDLIVFSLNDPDIAVERKECLQSWFSKTELIFVGEHRYTHYYPLPNIVEFGKARVNLPCMEPGLRILFNYKGELVFCCEEVTPQFFRLGKFPDQSLEELLTNPYYTESKEVLKSPGGRMKFELCQDCPRG